MKKKMLKKSFYGLTSLFVLSSAGYVGATIVSNNNNFLLNSNIETTSFKGSGSNLTYDIANCTIKISGLSWVYNGQPKTPKVDVRETDSLGTYIASEGRDYVLSYENNIEAGTATIIVTGKGKYKGSQRLTFQIAKATDNEITNFEVSNNRPSATSKYGVVKFKYCTDQNFTSNVLTEYPTTSGTYYVKAYVEDNSSYNGVESSSVLQITVSANPTIKDISTTTVTLDQANYVYNGNEIIPLTTVKDNTTTLSLNNDYKVSCQNNINAGTAKLTITGQGNYVGAKEINFTITKATTNEIIEFKIENNVPTAKATFGFVQYKYWKKDNVSNVLTNYPTESGVWQVQAYVDETSNYVGATSKEILSLEVKMQNNNGSLSHSNQIRKQQILIISIIVCVSVIVLLTISIIIIRYLKSTKNNKK